MMTADSTTLSTTEKLTPSSIVDSDDGSARDADTSYMSVVIPFGGQMNYDTISIMLDEIVEQIKQNEIELELKRKLMNEKFGSYEKLTFAQKFIRRKSKTRQDL